MARDLLEVIQSTTTALPGDGELRVIDDVLERPKRHKPTQLTDDGLKAWIEDEFLQPPTSFERSRLVELQQRWETPTDYTQLLQMAPTQTRTITRFQREGLEGRVTGYREVTVPANNATAKNSTSMLRRPANRADFVRGAAGFFPFAPGGLDGIQAVADFEEQAIQSGQATQQGRPRGLDRVINTNNGEGLLSVAPGLQRGLKFKEKSQKSDDKNMKPVEELLNEEPDDAPKENGDTKTNLSPEGVDGEEGADSSEDEFDLLPVEYPALLPHATLPTSNMKGKRNWAHVVDMNRDIPNFYELVPEMAREWPFELDTFQKEAVYHLESGDSVFVAAHTSAGKTVVAEYAIALATKHMTKAIYTSPIKALSNQKFRDFRNEFQDVGILTGDVQINPEASCVIMTTEILRSMLYRGADLIRDVEYVIFDEVHYVSDLERGVVWEEVIIMLPEHVSLILLSATVPNTFEFASWVGRTKKKDIYVISTPKRPVPLEHYLWANKAMHKIVSAEKKFLDKGWKDANDALSGRDKIKAPSSTSQDKSSGRGGARGNSNRGRGNNQRGGASQGGRGQAGQGRGNIARTGRGGGRTTAAQDRNIWVHLVQYLRKENWLPACIFVFSKKRCEENADALSNLDLCTASEKSAIHMTIERSIARLKPEDRVLPQIRRLRELLNRGIAVHHGGLLPIVKEVVEILFAKTLVKVLFATETFAMGLNLPTRTVVFSGLRKHDGHSFRELLPGEYTQMAGRAGRRGLDSVGNVVIVAPGADEAPPAAILRQIILGDPTKLRSQFRLTYNMILNLLRVEALRIEEMIKQSFSEHATQALLPEHERQVKVSEADLAKIKREPCQICDEDLESCHSAAVAYQAATIELHEGLPGSPIGRRLISPRRVVVFHRDGIRMAGIISSEGIGKGTVPAVEVLTAGASTQTRQSSDLLPYLPKMRKFFSPLPQISSGTALKLLRVPLREIDSFTNTMLKVTLNLKDKTATDEIAKQLAELGKTWHDGRWDELDWSARIKEFQLREVVQNREEHLAQCGASRSFKCPNFVKHFAMCHDEWLIKENIVQLRQLLSDQNLQLLPDYEQRIQVLKDLDFIDEGSRVGLKGKVACEIHSADELILTELILENVLADFEPEEIVALLSAFVFQEKTDTEPNLTPVLERGKDEIVRISEKVNDIQIQHQVILSSSDSNDFVSKPRFGLVEVVYEWARGMSFNRITDLTDVLEGTIVRVITRLDETCREAKNAARIIGDPKLFTKMQTAQELIKRDITAVASLYM